MDFSFNNEQENIRNLAKQIFTDYASDEKLAAFTNNENSYDDKLWSVLAKQGLLGISVPSEFGGSELGLTELCLLLEEQGRFTAPVPLMSNLILGVLPIIEFGSHEQKKIWLPKFINGNVRLSAAIADIGMPLAATKQVYATQQNGNWILNGQKECIPDGNIADCVLIPAVDELGKTKIFLLDPYIEGVDTVMHKTSIGDVLSTIHLNNVCIANNTLLPSNGDTVIDWITLRAHLALCALQVGITEEAIRRTALFTSERKQFGVPIGSFQAVAMQAADAYINLEAMRSTYWSAMFKLINKQPAHAAITIAKYWACDGSHKIVHTTQHLHGGIGSDISFPIHRFFLWAKHVAFMFGGSSIQVNKLGDLLSGDNATENCQIPV